MPKAPKAHQEPMLAWLTQVADIGGACPTNDQIAERFDYSTPSFGSQLLSDLEMLGLIKVDRFQASRIVTVMSTGKSTARPANVAPHWRDRPDRKPPMTNPDQIGEAPIVPIATIAEDDPSLASEIIAEAKRRHRPITSFLSELVAVGWFAYRADLQEGGA